MRFANAQHSGGSGLSAQVLLRPRALLLLVAAALGACTHAPKSHGKTGAGSAAAEYVRRAGAYGFSGVVLGTIEDRVVLEEAAGLAEISTRRSNTPDTLFDIGSLAKQFTAAAILKLEEEGRLKTSDRVGRFFPGLPDRIAGLTLHQLLTHTSGLPWDVPDPRAPLTREGFFAWLGGAELQTAAGTRYGYSNAGYTLLAAIVEEASGLPFEAFLRERLFRPSGMSATGYLTGPLPGHPAARGYLADEDRGFPWDAPDNIDGRPSWSAIGAGSVISTARDIDRWAAALLSGRIISDASVARLFACHVETGPGECYGYGWNIEAESARRLIWHDGSNGSFWARLSIYPDDGLRFTILSNKSLQHGWIVDARLRQVLLEGAVPILPPIGTRLAADDIRQLAGRYAFGSAEIAFERVGEDLFIEPRDREALALLVPMERRGEQAEQLTAAAAAVLDAAGAGNFDPLRAAATSEDAYQRMRESLVYFRDRGPQLGGFHGFGIIGTSVGPTGVSLATYAFASFGAGRGAIRLVWRGDRLADIMIQTAAFVNPPRFAVQRRDSMSFVAHSLALQRTIEVALGSDDQLTLIVDGRTYVGRKMNAPAR